MQDTNVNPEIFEVLEKEYHGKKGELGHGSSERDEFEIRKEKITKLFKEKKNWIYYGLLAIITYISIFIRTRNLPGLRDITTNDWTLGPDLDPFLFLRWAEYIVEHGKLMAVDLMRYVPLGYDTARELKLHSYLIAWFHEVLSTFNQSVSVTYSAIIFPVFMFALTAIAFFLFSREIFHKENETTKNIIALIATALFVVIPSLLPRTIAGIPEKESAAFFFMFISFYFFMKAFRAEKLKRGLIFGVLAGVMTAGMSLIWGGMVFIFFGVSLAFLLSFLVGNVKKKEFLVYFSWMLTAFILMIPNFKSGIIKSVFASSGYRISNLITSTSTGLAVAVFALVGLSLFLLHTKNEKLISIRKKIKLPKEAAAFLISLLVLLIAVILFFGPSFIFEKISDVKSSLVSPLVSRFGLTVAENRQPYFVDWRSSFGPIIFKLPIFFWMFFIGAVTLFGLLVKKFNRKEKWILILAYIIFLSSSIFSRYSEGSILNGTNGLSILFYFGGALLLIGVFGRFFYLRYKKGEFEDLKYLNFNYIIYLLVLTLAIVSARGAVRFIMILGAVAPVAIAFLVVKTSKKYLEEKEETRKFLFGILAIVFILAAGYTTIAYYNESKNTASYFYPGPYQWQWQEAMSWVRENTAENAVFAHWWDYGYWVQSIGERATVLDGSNNIAYWNHLMGRYGLTGDDEKETLEYFYAHNVTNFLIDSTDIGKYTAFSSIGSDENYDRYAWIPAFVMDQKQTQETNNQTFYFYGGGGSSIDEDIIWDFDGNEVLLPRKAAGIGAVIVKMSGEEFLQPEGIFVYNGKNYNIPLRYVYVEGKVLDFKSGLEAGVFLFPTVEITQQGGANVNKIGAMYYLSPRTINSRVARLYLFGEETEYFKIVHQESSYIVDSLRQQGLDVGEFMLYQGFQGPIKIWEVSYPVDIEFKPELVQRDWPNPELDSVKPGEY